MSLHRSRNTLNYQLELSNVETSEDVNVVRRITIRWNNELVPTNTSVLTFSPPTLIQSIKFAFFSVPVGLRTIFDEVSLNC